jgi:hypothetical protein
MHTGLLEVIYSDHFTYQLTQIESEYSAIYICVSTLLISLFVFCLFAFLTHDGSPTPIEGGGRRLSV